MTSKSNTDAPFCTEFHVGDSCGTTHVMTSEVTSKYKYLIIFQNINSARCDFRLFSSILAHCQLSCVLLCKFTTYSFSPCRSTKYEGCADSHSTLSDKKRIAFATLFAESEGFEPPEQLPVHRISSAARSTTPATFLVKGGPISISPPFINSREEM